MSRLCFLRANPPHFSLNSGIFLVFFWQFQHSNGEERLTSHVVAREDVVYNIMLRMT